MKAEYDCRSSKAGGFRVQGTKLLARPRTIAAALAIAALCQLATVRAVLAAALLPVPVSTVPSTTGDTNPYGVLFVSGRPGGTLQPGDILVSNFNNSAGVMFLGTTIVDIRNGAQTATPFYTSSAAGEGLSLALGQLQNFIVIGNVPDNAGPGALTVLNSSGRVVNTLSSDPAANFINGPWGMATNLGTKHGRSTPAQIFISNVIGATVWRLDVSVNNVSGVTLDDEVQLGGGYLRELTFPTLVNGPAGLAYDAKHDILYVASELDNEIFAIDDAGTLTTDQSTRVP
jgi:hypothetical protein